MRTADFALSSPPKRPVGRPKGISSFYVWVVEHGGRHIVVGVRDKHGAESHWWIRHDGTKPVGRATVAKNEPLRSHRRAARRLCLALIAQLPLSFGPSLRKF